jgi:tetratricopeptide (TPR) repeat protein
MSAEVVMGKQLRPIRTHSGLRCTALLPYFALLAAPITAQVADTTPLEVRLWRMGTTRVVDLPDPPPRPETVPVAGTISADLLRHPLPAQARQMLQKAQRTAQSGDHLSAIRQLTEALAKYPESAAWIQPVLGIEYLKTDQFADAVKALEQAVLLLPRDAIHRSNLGLSLASVGEYDRAQRELRRALELDRSNVTTKQLLEVVEANNSLRNHD